jgi:hypothetical protein
VLCTLKVIIVKYAAISFQEFVSEYAVNDARDAGNGSLLASLAEAAFLIGLEKNR